MKLRIFAFALICSLALTGCSGLGPSSPKDARELVELLESNKVPCESFSVQNDELSGGQILSCQDETANQEPFAFLIWGSADSRESTLAGFCNDLARNGLSEQEIAVGTTWIAFSESSYYPIARLAEDLKAELQSGSTFCLEENLSVAPALSDEDLANCLEIEAGMASIARITVEKPSGLVQKLLLPAEGDELNSLFYSVRNSIRNDFSDDVPSEISEEVSRLQNLDDAFFRAGYLMKELAYYDWGENHSEMREEFFGLQTEIVTELTGLIGLCYALSP